MRTVASFVTEFLLEHGVAEVFIGYPNYEWRHIDGTIYRHDNAPHHKQVKTFLKHYHKGKEDFVVESYLADDPVEAARTFLKEIREMVRSSR